MKNLCSGEINALQGAFRVAMENPDYALREDITSLIDKNDVSEFNDAIAKRIQMTNALIGRCLDESGMSQSAFCREISCDKTQLNKAIKSVENRSPRSLPYVAMETLCNRFDLNMSLLFLGEKRKITLPRRYEMALRKLSTICETKQMFFLEHLQSMAIDYLSYQNIMTQRDPEKISTEDYRIFIGNRCRMYTDEKNLPPPYLIELGPLRRKATNLFEALNEEEPVFLGRLAVLLGTCYCNNQSLEYFLIRDFSQPRLVKDISFFENEQPSIQQLEVLRLLCSTELNSDLQGQIISEIMAS